MPTKTLRVYVDGAGTPAATRTVDASAPAEPVLLYGLAPGTHTIETTVQVPGRTETARTAPRTVRVAPYYVSDPFAAEGATLAQSLSLRCLLRNRVNVAFGETYHAGPDYQASSYNGTYLNDYAYSLGAFRGYWTKERVRAVVDAFGSHIGDYHDPGPGVSGPGPAGNPVIMSVPQVMRPDGTVWAWWSWGFGRWPDTSKVSDFAQAVIYCHDLGDPTAWSTYRAALEACLVAFPTASVNGGKLLYTDPVADVTTGWVDTGGGDGYYQSRSTYHFWDESIVPKGNIATGSAEFCHAYLLMKRVADALGDAASAAAYQAQVDAYVLGLRSLRITSGEYAGFYQPCSIGQAGIAHVPTTLLVAVLGLCDATERTETLNAIRAMYEAGRLSRPSNQGYVRLLVSPQAFLNPNFFWGDYWSTTIMPSYIARALQMAGRSDLAASWVQGAVKELGRQHREAGTAPRENVSASAYTGQGGNLQSFSAGWVADLSEALPEYVDLALAGGLGSSASVSFPHGHLIHRAEVIAPAPGTVGVQIDGYALAGTVDANGTPTPTANPTWTAMGTITLAGQSSARMDGVTPVGAYGGVVRATVASGAVPGTLTVRLHMKPPGVPKLVPTGTPGTCWIPPGFVADAGVGTGYVMDELPADGVSRTVILRACDGSEVSRATGAYFTVRYE